MIFAWIDGQLVKEYFLSDIPKIDSKGNGVYVFCKHSSGMENLGRLWHINACSWFVQPLRSMPKELRLALLIEGIPID